MKERVNLNINGNTKTVILEEIISLDGLKEIYFSLEAFTNIMIRHEVRRPNIPEVFTEGLFCYLYPDFRRLSKIVGAPSSADLINIKTGETAQLKAASIQKDCTSFGPKTVFDQLHFMVVDRTTGSITIYYGLDYEKLKKETIRNRPTVETFEQQQERGVRPHICLHAFIEKEGVKPAKNFNINDK